MPIDLDFRSTPRWRKPTLVLLVLGLLASGAALVQRHHFLQLREDLRARLDTRGGHPSRGQPVADSPRPTSQTKEMREVIAALQRPWQPMFQALHEAIRPDIQVTGLQQDNQATRWRISGEADSSAALAGFLQRLRSRTGWAMVHPVSEIRQTVPGAKPVGFQLLVEWRQP